MNTCYDQMALSRLNKKLEAAPWGLFFTWTGVAVFTHIGRAVGLIGVGIIVLGAQAARKYLDLELKAFWVTAGLIFVASGLWKFFNVHLGLVPVLCIVAGAALLVSMILGRPRE